MVRRGTSTRIARWAISGFVAGSDSTSTFVGWCSMVSASVCTAGGNVAEKNRFWRCLGSSSRMRASSSLKPKSSRRSASSRTSIATREIFRALWSIRSSRRPGVATTMSAPPRSAIICGLIDTPPNTIATLTGMVNCTTSLRTDSPTCAASSRVGTRIRPCSWRGPSRLSSSDCSSGSTKAAVLPEPVWAAPSTSSPRRMAGIASRWMAVGSW